MKYILIILLSLASLSKAEFRSDNPQTAMALGYSMCSVYDIYWASRNKPYIYTSEFIFPTIHYEENLKVQYVMGKISVGLFTGVALSFYNAQKYDTNPPWQDIVYGGLGGLTSVIIHF